MVAPSGMMDGTIQMVREALDNNGFVNLPIMAYSVKHLNWMSSIATIKGMVINIFDVYSVCMISTILQSC